MNMKSHILMSLREQFNRWEEVLAGMSAAQLNRPHLPSEWCTKDEIAHLRAWQQRSIARFEAAVTGREPEFPAWLAGLDPEAESATQQVNAWIYEAHREQPWPQVYSNWRAGFLRFLELGEAVSEIDLLDSGKYPWLDGHPLAFILLASYDHHVEHLDKLIAWLEADAPTLDRAGELTAPQHDNHPSDPQASRPNMPEYGLLDADQGRGLLPWGWALERLETSHNYWLATTRPDGGPHGTVVWGVWVGNRFYFSTDRRSRKARNLALNGRCVVCTESAAEAVIVEGAAHLVGSAEIMSKIGQVYQAKYGVMLPGESNVYAVEPVVVFGFDETEFSGSATRWRFKSD